MQLRAPQRPLLRDHSFGSRVTRARLVFPSSAANSRGSDFRSVTHIPCGAVTWPCEADSAAVASRLAPLSMSESISAWIHKRLSKYEKQHGTAIKEPMAGGKVQVLRVSLPTPRPQARRLPTLMVDALASSSLSQHRSTPRSETGSIPWSFVSLKRSRPRLWRKSDGQPPGPRSCCARSRPLTLLSSFDDIAKISKDVISLQESRPTLFRDEDGHMFLGLEVLKSKWVASSLGDIFHDHVTSIGRSDGMGRYADVLRACVPLALTLPGLAMSDHRLL